MIKDRQGNVINTGENQDKVLKIMYGTTIGRNLLKILVQPVVSELAGRFMDSKYSKFLIPGFIRSNNINLDDYKKQEFDSYNDCFTREIKDGLREFSTEAKDLCAPCDSKLSVYPISDKSTFLVKNTVYTMEQLTRSKRISKEYQGGYLMIFRLAVDDYHHYSFIDDGVVSRNFRIPGFYHTVNPIAGDYYPIYKENTREFSFLDSENFGTIMMMEVGALLVGRIDNFQEKDTVSRGEEKGMFEFGGSTVILAFKKDQIIPDEDIICNSMDNCETVVKMGQIIGRAKK